MAKQFAVISTATGLTAVGTLETWERTRAAEHHYGKDANGDTDAESLNNIEESVDFTLEMEDESAFDALSLGDAITDGDTRKYTIRELKDSQSNDGSVRKVTGRMSRFIANTIPA